MIPVALLLLYTTLLTLALVALESVLMRRAWALLVIVLEEIVTPETTALVAIEPF